jgi:hypothetical protein
MSVTSAGMLRAAAGDDLARCIELDAQSVPIHGCVLLDLLKSLNDSRVDCWHD